jgi:hypothetical protein
MTALRRQRSFFFSHSLFISLYSHLLILIEFWGNSYAPTLVIGKCRLHDNVPGEQMCI